MKHEASYRFELERVESKADRRPVVGWESRTRTATCRADSSFFREIFVIPRDVNDLQADPSRSRNAAGQSASNPVAHSPLLEDWLAVIERDARLQLIKPNLKSPEFAFAGLVFAIEHQRQLRSLVVRWDRREPEPDFPAGWEPCPPADRSKKWHRRRQIIPSALSAEIDAFELLWAERQPWLVFDRQVEEARAMSPAARLQRLQAGLKIPRRVERLVTEFVRSPYVVAEVLIRAHGKCERCKLPAPFMRRADGSPYLEVHHTIQLADGGEDTVENAEALCPNCHRKAHHG